MPARPLALFALAMLAAPLAAKPGMPADPARGGDRGDAIAHCVARVGGADGADPAEVEQLCGCAADRLLAEAAGEALDAARLSAALGPAVLRCLPEIRPRNAGALAAAAMRPSAPPIVEPPAAMPTEASADKPVADDGSAAPSGPGLIDRLDSLFDGFSFSSLPRWAWWIVALLGVLLLRRLFRRPERNDDLMGPPRPDRYRNLPRY